MPYPVDQLAALAKANVGLMLKLAEVARKGGEESLEVGNRAAGRFDMDGEPAQRDHKLGFLPAIDVGDVDAALAAAPVVLDEHYATPVHFPAALEPHASTVWFDGDVLTVRTSNQ
ncbi:hypothetical protein LTR94_025831, partial [Friedmanniomyces endolithicus]